MIAICQIRDQPAYRRDAFLDGLRIAGYGIKSNGYPKEPMDLLVIWNRYGGYAAMADTWEKHGGTVLVCENGYIGVDNQNRQLYAISANGHNGSGWFPDPTEDRFSKLNIEVLPWKETSPENHMLVCGQRGIGTKLMASPDNWHSFAQMRLKRITARPVKIRLHPGNHAPKTPLMADLEGAHACVIWSSSSGVKSLVNGYPVFYDAPHWICSGAAAKLGLPVETPLQDDDKRMAALQHMAHAQWTVDEIQSGEPFVRFREDIARGRRT